MKKLMNKDRMLSIILLLISLFFIFNTTQLRSSGYAGDPGPKMFPFLGAGICVLCAVLLFIKPTGGKGKKQFGPGQFKDALKLLAMYAGIGVLLWLLGFAIAMPIFLFILCFMFSKVTDENIPVKKNVIRSAVYAIIIGAVLYAVFVIALDTQLPTGLIPGLLKN